MEQAEEREQLSDDQITVRKSLFTFAVHKINRNMFFRS